MKECKHLNGWKWIEDGDNGSGWFCIKCGYKSKGQTGSLPRRKK